MRWHCSIVPLTVTFAEFIAVAQLLNNNEVCNDEDAYSNRNIDITSDLIFLTLVRYQIFYITLHDDDDVDPPPLTYQYFCCTKLFTYDSV